MAYCVPELEYAVYLGDDVLLVQPKINDNFHIKKFKMDIYYGGSHENTVYITDEPCYVRYNMPIYPGNNYIDLTLDLVGIDDSGKHITGVSAITDPSFTLLTPVKNVSIEKTGDRRYKISWDKVANSPGYALNMYTEGSEQPAIIGDFIHTDSYEVDLSGQPRDAVWSCRIWARSHNARSVSLPTLFEFRESDYEQ